LIPVHREHAAQFIVGIRDSAYGVGELCPDIFRDRQHIAPACPLRDGKTVLSASAENGLLCLCERTPLLAFQLCDSLVGLVLPLVAEALVEHERQDVVLVILPGGLAPEDVGSAPEMGFELLLSQSHDHSL
jgi:hypothetical protein